MADPSSTRNNASGGDGAVRWPWHGWLGLGLVAVFWWLNWTLEGPRSHWGFFPLWLGYALVVDALALLRTGSSMLTRAPGGWLRLFVVSIPAWWLFELLNWRARNWSYQGRELFGDLDYFLLASLSFSTVMPAVFGSAELVSSFGWLDRFRAGPRITLGRRRPLLWMAIGAAMLTLLLIWPRYFFPFLWLSVWFLLEPINQWLGNRTLLEPLARGDWRPVVSLGAGALLCGFFWELWNFYSYPKWVYHVPFVDFLHVFEMPLLGYGGYVPFALELFAIHQLLAGSKPAGPILTARG